MMTLVDVMKTTPGWPFLPLEIVRLIEADGEEESGSTFDPVSCSRFREWATRVLPGRSFRFFDISRRSICNACCGGSESAIVRITFLRCYPGLLFNATRTSSQ
jgi:hypothetical protein